MNVKEWALVIFTILAQMSVGAFWVLGVLHAYAARKAGVEEADRMSDRALLGIIPVLALGMLASLLHLGSPFSAYKAVTNVGSSWLSREILFGVLFLVFGALYVFLQWRKVGPVSVRSVVSWVAALCGAGLVYSMANVYMLYPQPGWNTLFTPLSFFVTTLLLGALAIGAALVWNYSQVEKHSPDCADVQCDLMRDSLRWISVASIVLLGIQLVALPIYLSYLSVGNSAATTTLRMMFSSYGLLFTLRLALVFVGAGVFAVFLYQNASSGGQVKNLGSMTYSAFVVVLAAEIMARYLFYATQVQVGL